MRADIRSVRRIATLAATLVVLAGCQTAVAQEVDKRLQGESPKEEERQEYCELAFTAAEEVGVALDEELKFDTETDETGSAGCSSSAIEVNESRLSAWIGFHPLPESATGEYNGHALADAWKAKPGSSECHMYESEWTHLTGERRTSVGAYCYESVWPGAESQFIGTFVTQQTRVTVELRGESRDKHDGNWTYLDPGDAQLAVGALVTELQTAMREGAQQ